MAEFLHLLVVRAFVDRIEFVHLIVLLVSHWLMLLFVSFFFSLLRNFILIWIKMTQKLRRSSRRFLKHMKWVWHHWKIVWYDLLEYILSGIVVLFFSFSFSFFGIRFWKIKRSVTFMTRYICLTISKLTCFLHCSLDYLLQLWSKFVVMSAGWAWSIWAKCWWWVSEWWRLRLRRRI